MADIGNIIEVDYNLINNFKNSNGEQLKPNDTPYGTLVDETIKKSIREIGSNCLNDLWINNENIEFANKRVIKIFNAFSQAIVNYNDKVSRTKNRNELSAVSTDFLDNFLKPLKFKAEEIQPGYRYIININQSPFNIKVHPWFVKATRRDKIGDDNGTYHLIGQLVDRVYLMLVTTEKKAIEILNQRKKELSGQTPPNKTQDKPDSGPVVVPVDPESTTSISSETPATTEPPTASTETPATTEPRTISATPRQKQPSREDAIRALFSKKYKLERNQAYLINILKKLTSEARKIYVRQFLNEGEEANGVSSTGEEVKDQKNQNTGTITVKSNDERYKKLVELLDNLEALKDYQSKSYIIFKNHISSQSKYLSDVFSGKIKSNMSINDRINAFSNFKYNDFDKEPETVGPMTSLKTSKKTEPKSTNVSPMNLPTTTAPGQAPTNAGPSQPPEIPVTAQQNNPQLPTTTAAVPPPTNAGPEQPPVVPTPTQQGQPNTIATKKQTNTGTSEPSATPTDKNGTTAGSR